MAREKGQKGKGRKGKEKERKGKMRKEREGGFCVTATRVVCFVPAPRYLRVFEVATSTIASMRLGKADQQKSSGGRSNVV